MKKAALAMQVAFGLILCVIILWAWLYSPIPLWEVRYPHGSQPIGWRTATVAVIILLVSQYLSRIIFRQLTGSPLLGKLR